MKKTSKSENLTKFVTFTNHLIAIPKTQDTIQNVISVGNNTLAVPKPSLAIGLTIILTKAVTVNLRTKNKFAKTFPPILLLR